MNLLETCNTLACNPGGPLFWLFIFWPVPLVLAGLLLLFGLPHLINSVLTHRHARHERRRGFDVIALT